MISHIAVTILTVISIALIALAWRQHERATAADIAAQEANAWADHYRDEHAALAARHAQLERSHADLQQLYADLVARRLAANYWIIATTVAGRQPGRH